MDLECYRCDNAHLGNFREDPTWAGDLEQCFICENMCCTWHISRYKKLEFWFHARIFFIARYKESTSLFWKQILPLDLFKLILYQIRHAMPTMCTACRKYHIISKNLTWGRKAICHNCGMISYNDRLIEYMNSGIHIYICETCFLYLPKVTNYIA